MKTQRDYNEMIIILANFQLRPPKVVVEILDVVKIKRPFSHAKDQNIAFSYVTPVFERTAKRVTV